MSLIFYAVKSRSGERLARLPLSLEGDLGTTISTFSSATFVLDVNDATCPADWATMTVPMLHGIVAVEEDQASGYSQPIWFGLINDNPTNSAGAVRIPCASAEWYLSTHRAKDARFEAGSDLMAIPRELIRQIEAGGVGLGLETDLPDAGVKRALVLKESDGKAVTDVLDMLAMEWTIALEWADANQAKLRKIFRAREPFLGVIADHPDTVMIYPGNVISWDYAAPMTEGKTATRIVIEGDGTGDTRTTSLPRVDAEREAAGYPRIEVYRSVGGVTNVNDANALADDLAKDLFTRTHVINATVRNAGETALRGLVIGSTVRIIIDSPTKQLDESWRFVGWTMDGAGQFWKPTLARLGTKTKNFPRAASPRDAALAQRDATHQLELGSYADPLVNGYTFPYNEDGNAFAIDPSLGFGSYDLDGAFTPFAGTGGSTGGSTNPGSGTGDGGAGWGFGSEGFDPGDTAATAAGFTLGNTFAVEGLSGPLPSCQNEGNLVFGTTANASAFTTMDYRATKPAAVPADAWGFLGVFSGYLQTGQVCDWAQRQTVDLSGTLIDQLVVQSSAAVRPAPVIFSGELSYYFVTQVDLDWSAQPFATGGWLYMPVMVTVTWAVTAYGSSYPMSKSCIRFLRMKYTTYKTLEPAGTTVAEIAGTGPRAGFKVTRAGSQVMIAAPAGSSSTTLYAGEFHDGELWSDGFTVLPAVTGAPGQYTISKASDGSGAALYGAAGQLHLGSGIYPRTSEESWAGMALPQYQGYTSTAGRVATVGGSWNGSRTVVSAAIFNPDSSNADGIEGVGTSWSYPGSSPHTCFSYRGWVYGMLGDGYLAAQFIPTA